MMKTMSRRNLDSTRLAAFALVGLVLFAACAPGDTRFSGEEPAGFWFGLWHGMIAVFAFIASLFSDNVAIYEAHNTGGWYDFGFLVGVTCTWGGSSHTYSRRVYKTRNEKEWEEVGQKVEAKIKRRIREWAEAEPDEDWRLVEEKAEQKLKQRLREWGEAP
jgi:hypothetical protein